MSNNTIVDERLAAVEKELEAEKKKTNGLAIELANEKRVSNALREDVEQQKRLKRMVDSKAKSDNTQLKKQVGELTASLEKKQVEYTDATSLANQYRNSIDEQNKKNKTLQIENAETKDKLRTLEESILQSQRDEKKNEILNDAGGIEKAANLREFLRMYLEELCGVFSVVFASSQIQGMRLRHLRVRAKNALDRLPKRNGVLVTMPRAAAEALVNTMNYQETAGLENFFVAILDQDCREIVYERFMRSSNDVLDLYDGLNGVFHENRLTRENVNEGLAELAKRNISFGQEPTEEGEELQVTKQVSLAMKRHDVNSKAAIPPKMPRMSGHQSTPQRRPAQRNSRSAPTPRSHYQHQTADVGHYGPSSGDRSRRAGQSSHFAFGEAQSFSPQGSFPGQGQSQDHGSDFGYYGPSTGDAQSRYNSAPGYSAQGQDYGGRFTSRDRGHNARF